MPLQCVFVLYPHRAIRLNIKENKNTKNTSRLVVSRCNSTWQCYGVPMHICHRRRGNNQEYGCHSRSSEVKSRAAVPKCISISTALRQHCDSTSRCGIHSTEMTNEKRSCSFQNSRMHCEVCHQGRRILDCRLRCCSPGFHIALLEGHPAHAGR